ncbi:multiple sugar transport system permease protein [Catalinimonas alkaloidigena]|uniref:Multiple sugar transport system permease protein n=1 Tax=Catalinimonas alkaloidigena TaxID=1075417 RepID=A0A1G9E8R4_9BACT|nr:sugar ABC transporter permease [Catalinimonas alkaloidigena]SDK72488.1 multiple sugar transport system permease protein [Catalinimonas alkaloidigena]
MALRRKNLIPYLMVAPYLLHLSVFILFPVVFSLVLTFHRWNIIAPMEWIGLGNFKRLVQDQFFWKSLGNTLRFLIVHIPLQIVIALFLAELLNRKLRFQAFFRAAFFLPVVVSGVVVTMLWEQLYGFDTGLLNRGLTSLGLGRIGWLVDPDWAMISIALMATWKNVGLYVILFLVGLQTVPRQYYEAAELEGASAWQQFRYITLPMINPTIFMVVVLSTIGGFSLFIEPYILTGGGPLNSTLSAVLYIYKQGFFYYHMGYAATLGFFFAFLILLVVVVQRRFIEREDA